MLTLVYVGSLNIASMRLVKDEVLDPDNNPPLTDLNLQKVEVVAGGMTINSADNPAAVQFSVGDDYIDFHLRLGDLALDEGTEYPAEIRGYQAGITDKYLVFVGPGLEDTHLTLYYPPRAEQPPVS